MRVEQLTFTRFIAAMLIIIFHFGDQAFPWNEGSISFVVSQSNIGVSYFFILSGFVMILAYGKETHIHLGTYLKNRLARVYPVYFLSLLLMFIYYVYLVLIPVNYYDLFLNISLLKAWIPGKATSFNSPAWTLSVELFFYLLFPFLMNHFYNKYDKIKQYVLPIGLIWVMSQLALHGFIYSSLYKGYPSHSHDFIYYFPVMHWSEFLIGNLAGLFFIHHWEKKTENYDWPIAGLLIALLLVLKYHQVLIFHNGLLAFLFIPFLVLLALNNGWFTRILKNKVLVFLGEISFGIYILQIPVFYFCTSFFDKIKLYDGNARFYLFVFILIAFSAFTYVFLESPLRRKIKRL